MTTWQDLILGNQSGGVKRRTRKNAGRNARRTKVRQKIVRKGRQKTVYRRNKKRTKGRTRKNSSNKFERGYRFQSLNNADTLSYNNL